MTVTLTQLACAACGWTPRPLENDPYPFRCPNSGTDDGDHVVAPAPHLGPRQARPLPVSTSDFGLPTSDNPFIRYRTSLYSWQVARSHGLPDTDYVSIVKRVDGAIARVAGCGFRVTPFARADRLGEALGFETTGGVWVKDETGNVAGSHKARHLMGVALYLEVLRQLGIDRDASRPLAVASCGNAALAAAVVARAIDRQLLVFVPDHASASILAQLEELGASVRRCPRSNGATGDPSYAAFREAISHGALPFSCQGNENGLVIEGAMTLVYEMIDQLIAAAGVRDQGSGEVSRPDPRSPIPTSSALDRVFVQVGGGALASAVTRAFSACVREGVLARMPRIHAVQTCGGHPLKRAYDLVVDDIFARLAKRSAGVRRSFASDDDRARYLLKATPADLLDEAFAYARTHRSRFMWPWETEPHSVATGILDDETYDWAVLVEGMVRSGGFPVIVDEATLEDTNLLAREATGVHVDHTGSSGLAGLVALSRSLEKARPTERVAVLFTGGRR